MSREIALRREVSLIPSEQEMKALEMICKYAVDSKYFQSLGGFPGVMCIALYAREIGVPVMTAIMGGFSNVQGKITMSAELMHSLLREAGVRIKIIRSDAEVCEIYAKRADTGDEYTSIYTINDARKANLIKGGGSWEKNPSDMLFARAISRLRRRLAPDVASRAYVEGELEEAEIMESPVAVKSSERIAEPVETAHDISSDFFKKFGDIEDAGFGLRDFITFRAGTDNKSEATIMKSAMKREPEFKMAYQKWVGKQQPLIEVTEEDMQLALEVK